MGLLSNLLGKNNTEPIYGCQINDILLVGLVVTKYSHIGYLMKNRGLNWQLDISSIGDNRKIHFFLSKCTLLVDVLEKMGITGCEGEWQNEILGWEFRK